MSRFTRVALGALLSIALVPFGASADHGCNGAVTQLDTPAGTFYIDDRGVDSAGVWVYQESNGTPGLQSGGNSAILGDVDSDACEHDAPDTLLV
jgi:hypothetical protein